ncbi:alpha/beta hydrolase [Acinetobacter sp. WZC-1]|uniref:alpha/beta hydrolase n=1 Tax=Acinetobacter sp. WZC-1 TaxID=3459034 RepID=UPI00403D8285
MIHTVIVPGVGGSGADHWQSWLQRQLMSCSRVQQSDWNLPILDDWIAHFVHTITQVNKPVQIVAHSFGCLTALAALNQYPELAAGVQKLILVAPANPARFGERGFARDSQSDYQAYFYSLKTPVPTEMIISENDPWLSFEDALKLTIAWKVRSRNLGQVGHINVASGFGPFPEIYAHLIPEQQRLSLHIMDDSAALCGFAV